MDTPMSASPRAMRWLLALVTMLALGPALFGGLVWDDSSLLVDNPSIRHPASLWELVSTPFWSQRMADGIPLEPLYTWLHRPVIKLLFHFGMAVGPLGPLLLHAVDLALHIGAALLLLDLLLSRAPGSATTRLVVGTSLALLFAVHPTRVESVAWICGVTDVAMTFFLLLALRFVETSTSGPRLVAAALAFALAGFCKETAVLAPALVCVDSIARSRPRRDVVRATAAAGVGASAVLVGWGLAVGGTAMPPANPSGASQTLVRVLATLGTFVERVVWPSPPTIYPGAIVLGPDGTLRLSTLAVTVGVCVLVAAGVVVLRSRRHAQARTALTGLAFFFVPLLPVSNFVLRDPRSLASDRFLYLPLVGVALLLVEPVAAALDRFAPRRTLVIGGVAALVLASALETLHSSERFADDLALFGHEVRVNPENAHATVSLMRAFKQDGRPDRAAELGVAALRRAVRRNDQPAILVLTPPYFRAELARLHDRDQVELRALRASLDALAESDSLRVRTPRFSFSAHVGARNAAALRSSRVEFAIPRAIVHGRTGDVDGAVRMLRSLVASAPSQRDAYDVLAIHEARSGDYDAAVRTLDDAIRRFPAVGAFRAARARVQECRALAASPEPDPQRAALRDANVQLRLGSPGAARALVLPVVRDRPELLLPRLMLAQIEEMDGSPERALATLDEAARAFPGNPLIAQQRGAVLERAGAAREANSR